MTSFYAIILSRTFDYAETAAEYSYFHWQNISRFYNSCEYQSEMLDD